MRSKVRPAEQTPRFITKDEKPRQRLPLILVQIETYAVNHPGTSLTETITKIPLELGRWRLWFAWRPVRVPVMVSITPITHTPPWQWVWLEFLERAPVLFKGYRVRGVGWAYRERSH